MKEISLSPLVDSIQNMNNVVEQATPIWIYILCTFMTTVFVGAITGALIILKLSKRSQVSNDSNVLTGNENPLTPFSESDYAQADAEV